MQGKVPRSSIAFRNFIIKINLFFN